MLEGLQVAPRVLFSLLFLFTCGSRSGPARWCLKNAYRWRCQVFLSFLFSSVFVVSRCRVTGIVSDQSPLGRRAWCFSTFFSSSSAVQWRPDWWHCKWPSVEILKRHCWDSIGYRLSIGYRQSPNTVPSGSLTLHHLCISADFFILFFLLFVCLCVVVLFFCCCCCLFVCFWKMTRIVVNWICCLFIYAVFNKRWLDYHTGNDMDT